MDFRVGGSFTCVMQIAGTGEFTYKGVYDEIVEPEKIAYHADFGPTTTRVVVEFIDLPNAQTKLVLTQVGFPARVFARWFQRAPTSRSTRSIC